MVNYSSNKNGVPNPNQGAKAPTNYDEKLQKILAAAGNAKKGNATQPGTAPQPASGNVPQPTSNASGCVHGITVQVSGQPSGTTAPASTGQPAQSPMAGPPQSGQSQVPAGQSPSAQSGPVPNQTGQPGQVQPAGGQPSANPYNQKLQNILAAAGGQKPIQPAPKPNSVLAKATAALNALKTAAMQDPSKILMIEDMEFDPNNGDDTIYLKCVGQTQAGVFLYDMFGCDIGHMVPDAIVNNHEAVDTTYYRNIPEDLLLTEFGNASGMGSTSVF